MAYHEPRFAIWRIMTPSGLYGSDVKASAGETYTADEAVKIAEASPINEKIVDIAESRDEHGEPVGLLIVED